MRVHTGAEATSKPSPDAVDHGSGPDTCDESQFNEKIAELGLEQTTAYVRVVRAKRKISDVATKKREYRAKRKAEGFEQYVVEVPIDEDAKSTVYAVAQAIVADKEDIKNLRSTILSVVSSEALLELAQLLIASGVDASSIMEPIKRGDLAKIAAINAARPTLLDDVCRLAKTNDEFLSVLDSLLRHAGDISDGSEKGLLEAAVAASGCPEALSFILELAQLLIKSGADASSTIELIKRGDLAKMTAIHAASPTLLDDVSGLAMTNDRFVSVLDSLVRHAGGISDGSAKGLLEAAVAASGYPEVLSFVEVRQRGGLRARLLGWVLGRAH